MNNHNHFKIKALRREQKRRKIRYGATGGSFGAQAKRARVSRGYEGLPRALRPRIKLKLKK